MIWVSTWRPTTPRSADPATLERISRDNADAMGLGLQGTPSFFIDGEPAAIASLDDLAALVEQALGE